MQNEIIAKIDALVKMSESTSNVSTLQIELEEIDQSLKEKKLELAELKASISDEKYFDASSEIVDKNIEISLNKKIKMLNKSLADIKQQIEKAKKEESISFQKLDFLKREINEQEHFIEVLNAKISSAQNSQQTNFESLLKNTENKLKENKKSFDKEQKAYDKIQGKIEVLCYSEHELENKLESETDKLLEVKANLLNRRSYVNAELKKEDQEEIERLKGEIAELENKKTEILSDAVMVAEEAKNYLIDDDKTSALKKIKELRDSLDDMPYMNVVSGANTSLEVELENAEAKRDEFASMINSKNYESVDVTLIKDRISYITDKKEKLFGKIEEIKKCIAEIDTAQLDDLNNRISYCENEVETLREKLDEYEETLNNEDLPSSKKVALQASYNKKQEEFENVVQLLNLYRNDRQALIIQSYHLEIEVLGSINEEIENIDKEIKQLEKLSITSNKAKDVISIENDKKTLKELNDVVKAIKKRQAFGCTPAQLYDEIEILLGTEMKNGFDMEVPTLSIEDINEEIQDPIPTEVINEEFQQPLPVEEINTEVQKVPVVEETTTEIPETPVVEETVKIEDLPIIPAEELGLEISNINQEENKFKVVEVESLDENTNENNDFLIGDYEN